MIPLRKFIFSLFLLSTTSLSSQRQLDIGKKKIFDSLEARKLYSALDVYENGKEMRKYAQTDYEFARSYHTMGDGKYKDGDYQSAIPYLEKADKYAQATKATDIRIAVISLLVDTYRFAGLPNESDEKLKIIERIADKNNVEAQTQVLQAKAKALEIDKKFCEAIPIRKQELDLYQNKVKFSNELFKKEILSFANIHMAYLKIKCGNQDEALKNLQTVEAIYTELGNLKPTYYIENYYLVKALLSLSEKDNINVKLWFLKSYESAKKTYNKMTIKKILTEMRNSKIFNTSTEKNEIAEALLNIQNFQTEVTKDVTKTEVEKKNLKLKNEKNNQILIGTISTVIVLGLLSLVFYYKQRNKKLQARYQLIISSIEQKKEQKLADLDKELPDLIANYQDDNQTREQEIQIVNDLTKLEEKQFFTAKNISATQLAAMLKTTPRNLTYILKKYRNDDFYNYLNTLRIDYISDALQRHPRFLNYKIAVLAEMCGYSSHSHFTLVFKTVLS